MGNLNLTDNLDTLIKSYTELEQITRLINYNDAVEETPLSELKSIISTIDTKMAKTLKTGVISNSGIFNSLSELPRLVTKIIIYPRELNLPFKGDLSSSENKVMKEQLYQSARIFATELDAALVYSSTYALKEVVGQVSSLTKTNADYRTEIRELKTSLAQVQVTNLEKINTIVSDTNIELLELKSEFNHQSKSEINALLQGVNGRIDEKFSEYSNKLNDSAKKLNLELKQDKMDWIAGVEGNIVDLNSEIAGIQSSLQSQIQAEVKEFANQKNRLTAILGSLSQFRRSKSDIDQAENEKRAANTFRWFGLVLMFLPLAIFMLFFVAIDTSIANKTTLAFTFPAEPSGYLLRFLTIILFSSPSVYLLKESAYHRKQERHYRERGLQLASIDPFLEDFTPDKRMEAKTKLMNSFYAPNDGKADTSNVPDMVQQIKDVATLSKSLSKILPTHSLDKNTSDQIIVPKEKVAAAKNQNLENSNKI
ncbi:hypothetical protein BCV35_015725 [Vibrio cyclitrophicus]|uniref:hypothetical protein n=1 Tax=Vibrio cyclitrophicus TaxID=47951 RepID=UPI000C8193A7|nr:hypothetical protein [Vibrio cyclitrophicus]PME51366.1 hypothetical protein BCV35_06385 [Vibrio cyclitrophicus]